MRAFWFVAGLALLSPGQVAAQQVGATGDTTSAAFVATIGEGATLDTVAVERFVRSGDRLTGASAVAYPAAQVRSYTIDFAPDGSVRHIHIDNARPGHAAAASVDFEYGADSVHAVVRRDTLTRRIAVATPAGERPLPFYEDLFVFWEMGIRGALAGSADSTTLGTLAGRQVLPITVRRTGAHTVDFGFPDWGTVHATLGPANSFMRLDMMETTNKYDVRRVPSVDVEAVAARWGARPQPGQLSPRDTASAVIGGAHVLVDYGRPSVRGRKVFGGIVPFGEVWRTGANAATQLVIDHPIAIGDTILAAGTYSLFSLPTPAGWTLIINAQHSQWGTEYHPEQDVIRVPMTVDTTGADVERFTIRIEPESAGRGRLVMEWDGRRGSVAFGVR